MTRAVPITFFVRNFACLLFVVFPMMLSETAHAQMSGQIDLERPGDREFVLDTANMISDADEQKIKQIADKLLTDKAAPIIVVTIESMAQHGGAGLRIETFARLLFDQWGIGPKSLVIRNGITESYCWFHNRIAKHGLNWVPGGSARKTPLRR